MTVAFMAIAGVIVGLVLDELVARLAREPYERETEDGHEFQGERHGPGVPALDLGSEAGTATLPALLTTRSPYRRLAVVAATAAAFAVIGRQYAGEEWHLAVVAAYAAVFIVCAATDIIAFRVPNAVTYPAIIGALALGMVTPEETRGDVIVGGLIFGGLFFIMNVLTRGGMGMGDVKLALFAGLALGLSNVVPAMMIMALAGGAVAVVLLVTRIRGRGDPIPYAPYISLGALFAMLLQGTAVAVV